VQSWFIAVKNSWTPIAQNDNIFVLCHAKLVGTSAETSYSDDLGVVTQPVTHGDWRRAAATLLPAAAQNRGRPGSVTAPCMVVIFLVQVYLQDSSPSVYEKFYRETQTLVVLARLHFFPFKIIVSP
jgi:hypothetical protein